MKTRLVRLNDHDPRRGHVLRRYVYQGARFEAGKGWYKVTEQVGEHLKSVRQRAGDLHSPLAFDVCTPAEAKALDEKEAKEQQPQRPADNARVVETRDVPTKKLRPQSSKKKVENVDDKQGELVQ